MPAKNTLDVLIETIADVMYGLDESAISSSSTLAKLNAGSMERADILIEVSEKIGLTITAVKLREVAGLSLNDIAETFDQWRSAAGVFNNHA